MPFDELIRSVDIMAQEGIFADEVMCQIGNGTYIPKHCDYFRFAPSIEEYVDDARLVIGHGGTGTVLGLLEKDKQFIAVVNPLGADNHQYQFLERLSRSIDLSWTQNVSDLASMISGTNIQRAAHSTSPNELVKDIYGWLKSVQ